MRKPPEDRVPSRVRENLAKRGFGVVAEAIAKALRRASAPRSRTKDRKTGSPGATAPLARIFVPLVWSRADGRTSRPRSNTKSLLRRATASASRRFAESRDRRAKSGARGVAMDRFSKLHPYWYESAFDETLLERLPPGALDEIDAPGLAREWTRQFRYRDERRRDLDVARLAPVAQSFLSLLKDAETAAGVHGRTEAEDPPPPALPARAGDGSRTPGDGSIVCC